MDARPDAPIENGEPDVDGNGSLSAGRFDHGTNLDQQLVGFSALQIQILLHHPYRFTTFTRSSMCTEPWINAPGSFGRELAGAFVKVFPAILQRAVAKIVGTEWRSLG